MPRFASRFTLIGLAALLASACSDSPTVAPPVVTNASPTIESVVTAAPRAEADMPLQLAATVKDAETPIDKLTYTWSATPFTGVFSGAPSINGNQVTNSWRPPKGQTSPDLYTINLMVSESYTSAGQAKQNVVSKGATVHYNDSYAEAKALGYDFLVLKFGRANVSPAEAVSNFSDSCPGKAAELHDIEDNRAEFEIISASFPTPVASFNDTLTEGSVEGQCTFEDKPKSGPNAGKREFVSGTCLLNVIYENWRWRLCDSFFKGPYNTTLASLKGRVPGRPYPIGANRFGSGGK